MRKVTKESLAKWCDEDYDTCLEDDLYKYFGKTYNRWDWCEIYREGVSVWNTMFPEDEIDEDSPKGCVFAAITAHAAEGAYAAVATALGVDKDHLEMVVAEWYEMQDCPPPPVGYDGLKALVDQEDVRANEVR